MLSRGVPVVLAIDGRAASGKSSLAKTLAKDYAGRVVHMDDFFLPQELRTAERLSEPGGNLHYERFVAEILPGLRDEAGVNYQAFDCNRMQLGEWRNLLPAQLTIVEGAYALHPKLGAYYDLVSFELSAQASIGTFKGQKPKQTGTIPKALDTHSLLPA